jgi:hypothetical protein
VLRTVTEIIPVRSVVRNPQPADFGLSFFLSFGIGDYSGSCGTNLIFVPSVQLTPSSQETDVGHHFYETPIGVQNIFFCSLIVKGYLVDDIFFKITIALCVL